MVQRYNPPKQGIAGQIIDVIFLLALVFLALFAPLWLGWAAPTRTEKLPTGVTYTVNADGTKSWKGLTWEALGQNKTMQEQWQKVDYTLEQAADVVTQPFDYTIDYVGIVITAVVILGYFAFMLLYSQKEYRQVIAEKFD